MSLVEVQLWIWGGMFVLMLVAFELQRRRNDAGLVDVAWSIGLGLAALTQILLLDADLTRKLVIGGLAMIWSGRLGYFLLKNRIIGHHEDARYRDLRAKWQASAQPKFFVFFQLQACLVALMSTSFGIAMQSAESFGLFFDWIAIVIFVVAVVGEAIADGQLQAFKDNPANRGRTCRVGLWRYSRHPNYFFEFVHWWAYVAFAAGASVVSLVSVVLLGPALMYFFLMKVTGIPIAEARSLKTRSDYADYQRTTSMFFLWFSKKEIR